MRGMVSAKDVSTLRDLRVFVREKLITFLRENYPESIIHNRILLTVVDSKNNIN